MSAPPFTGDEGYDLASLRKAFPDWRIARATGRWWASRNQVREDAADALQAATPQELYKALMAREQPRT